MKRRMTACVLLLCMLCGMLASCGRTDPLPAESDPEDSTAIVSSPDQIGDDENQKIAAALLNTLLEGEGPYAGNGFTAMRESDGVIEWISSEQVDGIRAQVRAISKPFLTEASVRQLARKAAAFYIATAQDGRDFSLPGYDAVADIRNWDSSYLSYYGHELSYGILLVYTLYLLTPPKYAFSMEEVGFPTVPVFSRLSDCMYLALAGEYDSWRDALAVLQKGRQGVALYVGGFVPGVKPPDFMTCERPCALLQPDWEFRSLELADGVDLSNTFLGGLYIREELETILQECVYGDALLYYDETPEGEPIHVLIDPDQAAKVRELAERVTSPVMGTEDAVNLVRYYWVNLANVLVLSGHRILLPGADGKEDVLLDPDELGNETAQRRALAYLIDLFTPSAYRFTDLTPARGTYYVPAGAYNTPEEAITALSFGAWFLLADEEGVLCLVDAEGNTQPLDTYGAVLYGEEALIP